MIRDEINARLAGINHSASSNAKYHALETYLADLLQVPSNQVYTTYISKAGNTSVRVGQSPRANAASLLVTLVNPPHNESLDRSVQGIMRALQRRPADAPAEVLILVPDRSGWQPLALLAADGRDITLLRHAPELVGVLPVDRYVPQATPAASEAPAVQPQFTFYVTEAGKAPFSPPSYPCGELRRDPWDDDGLQTLFILAIHMTKHARIDIGDVKILQRGQQAGPTALPSVFSALSNDYCSLGQSYSYYERLTKLGAQVRRIVLRGLRDVAEAPVATRALQRELGFRKSVARTGTAARALEDARALLHPTGDHPKPSPSLTFTFSTNVGGEPFDIDFEFNRSGQLPDRVNAVIGYNGTGKTQLLANLALVASADLWRRDEVSAKAGRISDSDTTRFGSVIAISYSAFDTFALPDALEDSQAADLAAKRLEERGEVLGYAYCGLRKRNPDQPKLQAPRGLKSIDEIHTEFGLALELARSNARLPVLTRALAVVESEPSFERIGLQPYGAENDGSQWRQHFDSLSTGHKIILNVIVQIVGHAQQRSLVLIDEPESHLHPSLLAALLRALNLVLKEFDSYAIITTHSPVVIQEVPRAYVRILQRYGRQTVVRQPITETFGENIGYLTNNVFDLDSTQSDFHATLERLAKNLSLEQIERLFDDEMSAQARAYVRSIQRAVG